jgi:hypothetical protein
MLKGPKGQKRPTDVISNAVTVMKIATGEIEETLTKDGKGKAAVEFGRKAVRQGPRLYQRPNAGAIAKKAARSTRWNGCRWVVSVKWWKSLGASSSGT